MALDIFQENLLPENCGKPPAKPDEEANPFDTLSDCRNRVYWVNSNSETLKWVSQLDAV